MLRRDLLSLGMLLTAGGLVSTLPGVAEAKAKVRPGLLARGVKGTWRGKGNAHGSLTADVLVQRLTVDRGSRTLGVHGRIASSGGDGLAAFVSQPFDATAELTGGGSGGASCGVLTVDVGTIRLSIRGGLAIDPAPIKVNTSALKGRGRELGGQLCTLAGLLNGKGSLEGLEDLLARINDILSKGLITVPSPGAVGRG